MLQGTFRTNPKLIVTPWGQLDADAQESLRELRMDADFFGVAVVPQTDGSIKSIDVQTAGVLEQLRRPAHLPSGARVFLLADRGQLLLRLVLDDLLQLQTREGFVGGPAALPLLPSYGELSGPNDALGALSHLALRYAAALRVSRVDHLTDRLYGFNTAPVTPRLAARFGSANSIAHALGIGSGARLASEVAERWRGPSRLEEANWWTFSVPEAVAIPNDVLRFKVYVSSTLESLARTIAVVVPILKRHGCVAFKLGGRLEQLLRPDKFVAYFASDGQMLDAARALAGVVRGIPGQGVPFSASVDDAVVVSCGVDPPAETRPLSWQEQDSWRTWVTRRLARYLVRARRSAPTGIKAWEFALARLQLDGVDVARWMPAGGQWGGLGAPNELART